MSAEGRRLAATATKGLSTAPCSLLRLSSAFASRPVALRTSRIDETGMVVQYASCVSGWALANASPLDSQVTNTSGDEMVLFKADRLTWREVAVVAATHGTYSGEDLTACDLVTRGVPRADAARLVPVQSADGTRSCER